MPQITDLEVTARLLLAVILGGLIGLERESHGRPAGFRTHILVSVGSALVMILSVYAFAKLAPVGPNGRYYDPGRLAAQVVSGIGFLGAGTIMREGSTVRGLTTAASLWVVAGIGMATGAGAYFPAIMSTLLVVVTLLYLSRIEKRLLPARHQTIQLQIADQPGQLGVIASVLGRYGINIRGVDFDPGPEGITNIEMSLDFPAKLDRLALIGDVLAIPGVHSAHYKS